MSATPLLNNRTVIVTGAATGIGQAFALGLSAQGANVVVADIGPADETMAALDRAGGQALYVKADVSDAASVQNMAAQTLERFGRIDGLINNAAYFREVKLTDFDQIDPEQWDRIFEVNVRGTYLVTRLTRAELNEDLTWGQMLGVSMLAGIGFTVSLLVSDLTFTGAEADAAKTAVLAASVIAALFGAFVLRRRASAQ